MLYVVTFGTNFASPPPHLFRVHNISMFRHLFDDKVQNISRIVEK